MRRLSSSPSFEVGMYSNHSHFTLSTHWLMSSSCDISFNFLALRYMYARWWYGLSPLKREIAKYTANFTISSPSLTCVIIFPIFQVPAPSIWAYITPGCFHLAQIILNSSVIAILHIVYHVLSQPPSASPPFSIWKRCFFLFQLL